MKRHLTHAAGAPRSRPAIRLKMPDAFVLLADEVIE
jgi:hypothetical protein